MVAQIVTSVQNVLIQKKNEKNSKNSTGGIN